MDSPRPLAKPTQALLGVLALLGFGFRAAPLANLQGRLMAQWPTEDGYFMLTMARNIALGRGLSVAGGETPTNGTQPGTTFVWALGYKLFGTEREVGIFVALVLQLLGATLAAYLLYRLARRLFDHLEQGPTLAALTAGFWYASPVAMPHTMNCLETGFYGLMATAVALAYVTPTKDGGLWSWKRTILFGGLLGIAFWVRNDSAFLIAAVCLGYLSPALQDRESLVPRLQRVLAFGATSVAVASPWLIHNYTAFGHIMPVSGRAEALTGHFGGNMAGIPIVVAEYLMTVLPIPHAISDHPVVIAGATIVVLGTLGLLWASRKSWNTEGRALGLVVSIYLVGMVAFYGLYFGAAWFLPRYFLPLSPFGAIALFAGLHRARTLFPKLDALPLRGAAAAAVVSAMVFLSVRQYRSGHSHPHFQVVRWLEENVPEDVWVGAIQTGTIGFFHDRTVNLDGKVNIAAYEALLAGREGEYVVEDTEIQYLADWVGMRDWMTKPAIAGNFEVIVFDEDLNLAVLRRK